MRKLIGIPIILITLCLVVACQNSPASNMSTAPIDLADLIHNTDLPKNLEWAVDETSLPDIKTARSYRTSYLTFDPDRVRANLLNKEVVSSEIQAVGVGFQTGDVTDTEYLTVYDGGEQFGKNIDINGGLTYIRLINDTIFNYSSIISTHAGQPDMSEQLFGWTSRSSYTSGTDLPFMSYQDALFAVEQTFQSIDMPPYTLSETYSLDAATMREHQRLQAASDSAINLQQQNAEASDEDEAYLFIFQQMIDDIPVIHTPWDWALGAAADAAGNYMKHSTITVFYDHNGLVNMNIKNLFDMNHAELSEEQPLLTAAEAAQLLFKEYEKLLLEEGTRVVDCTLNYVAIPEKDDFQLLPAWVFTISTPRTSMITGEEQSLNKYSYHVIHAITGEKLSGAR